MKKLRPIMFVGTGSDVGKSVINAGFCRIFLQDGYRPAPFKAQNMSLNSYATPDGLEIGRAQAVQAEACGIECMVEMNPVLLKPTNYISSQVVLNGKPIGNKTASEYFLETDRNFLFGQAMNAYNKLNTDYNPIVIEGAGSISEINLWDKDITNMRVALETKAATYLVADIDKGGVFGSVYGTIELLPPEQKDLIKGIIINKFRGDISLFAEGRKILEKLTGKPVVGIIPYFRDIFIEQEDSVALEKKNTRSSSSDKINIVVILLPHMSNFTDFNMLALHDEVNLYYSNQPAEIEKADIIILPGSKNTIDDLHYIQKIGIDEVIKNEHKLGKQVYGICGGYQMMGQEITDPLNIESQVKSIKALGLLPITTELTDKKKTVQCTFQFLNSTEECSGYEIHMGETYSGNKSPLCKTEIDEDGYFLNAATWGTYIHGIFDNPIVVEYILKQIKPDIIFNLSYKGHKERGYNQLALLIRNSVDMEYIYKTITL